MACGNPLLAEPEARNLKYRKTSMRLWTKRITPYSKQEGVRACWVPPGRLALPANDDEALKRKREEIRQRLMRGETVVVDKTGSLQVPSATNGDAIRVPPGKLATPPNDDEELKRKREEIG